MLEILNEPCIKYTYLFATRESETDKDCYKCTTTSVWALSEMMAIGIGLCADKCKVHGLLVVNSFGHNKNGSQLSWNRQYIITCQSSVNTNG